MSVVAPRPIRQPIGLRGTHQLISSNACSNCRLSVWQPHQAWDHRKCPFDVVPSSRHGARVSPNISGCCSFIGGRAPAPSRDRS